jgi:hypothetical protein
LVKGKRKKNLRITEHGEKTNMKQTFPYTQAIGKGRCVEELTADSIKDRKRENSQQRERERKVASSATWERASAGHASIGRKACKAVKREKRFCTFRMLFYNLSYPAQKQIKI